MKANTQPQHTSRIRQLLDEAQEIRHIDYHGVLRRAQEAYDLALECGDIAHQSQSLALLCWGYVKTNRYEQALRYGLQANTLAIEHKLLYEEGFVAGILSICYTLLHDYPQSLSYLLRQADIGKQLHRHNFVSDALNDIGLLYIDVGHYATGINYLKDSINYMPRVDGQDTLEHGVTYFNLSRAMYQTGECAPAIDYCERALGIFHHTESPEWLAILHALMGCIYVKLGQIPQAKASIEQGARFIEEAEHKDAHALLHEAWGDYYLATGDHARAVQSFETLLGYVDEDEYIVWKLETIKKIAGIYQREGNFEQALKSYQHYHSIQAEFDKKRLEQQLDGAFTAHELTKRANQLQQEIDTQKQSEQERIERERLHLSLQMERNFAQVTHQILTRIGHEFRTPLSVIQSSSQIMELYPDRLSTDDKKRHFKNIQSKIEHIDQLLNDILMVLHITPPQATAQFDDMDVNTLCQQAILATYAKLQTERAVNLEVRGCQTQHYFHHPTLYTILVQLLSNAIKYSSAPIDLSVTCTADQMQIVIEDRGIGILPDEKEMIFEPLRRGSNTENIGGSGLGLTVVSNYVQLHKGTIDIESTPNIGTKVTVSLPIL